MTIQLAYQQLLVQLYEVYAEREAANIADWVIENITGQRKIDRIINKQLPLTNPQQDMLENYIEQLLKHRPVQYVLHEAWFANMKLYVDENVLIPRPETEELVDWIVKDIRNLAPLAKRKTHLLDVGTGSGCIALALKKQLPFAEVTGVDISAGALEVGTKNAAEQMLAIEFLQVNFLDKKARNSLQKFEVIVSNPPYIKQSEATAMAENVLHFEPSIALFVEDDNALIFYTAIAEFAKEHLAENGSVYVEINEAFGNEVMEVFRANGFKIITLKQDLQGRDRMIKASL